MSLSSPFEVARATHEEAERYLSALSSIINTLPSSSSSSSTIPTRSALTNAHLASVLLDRIVSRNRDLADFYADETGTRKEETQLLASGSNDSGTGSSDASGEPSSSAASMDSVMDLFYSRLNHIKSYHEKYPSAPPETFNLDLSALESLIAPGQSGVAMPSTNPMDRLFSGEEGIGRYLDLYEYHSQYLNLKGVRRVTYLNYLDKFDDFTHSDLSKETKRSEAYTKYVVSLRNYLVSYLRKIRPLEDVDALITRSQEDFEKQWSSGSVPGWEDQGHSFASTSKASAETPVSANGSSSGAPPKQGAPSSGEGIWCAACAKTFAKQTVYDAHLNGNKHKKSVERQEGGGTATADAQAKNGPGPSAALLSKGKTLAMNEFLIRSLVGPGSPSGPLSSHRVDTRSNVERRGALTERERAAEAEEIALAAEAAGASAQDQGMGKGSNGGAGGGEDDSDSDSDSKLYNPKKLPLGWDGRPIPVWLYKLHGLSVSFPCEICSDFSYQGRKNFDRHFTESRHAFGMRALGLPNTRVFHGITRIKDVVDLAEKMKKQGRGELGGGSGSGSGGGGGGNGPASTGIATAGGSGGSAPATSSRDVEEVEDEEGNTYTRRDYELLKRQGLI